MLVKFIFSGSLYFFFNVMSGKLNDTHTACIGGTYFMVMGHIATFWSEQ